MAEMKMQLTDWLDDLCVRFLVNLPEEELQQVERICFQIEEAQWFYEDFIRPTDPSLPQLHLAEFASRILRHCPLTAEYSDEQFAQAFREFMAYKTRVPVRGAIMLDADMERVLLVKGYKKNATWSFPRGKINHKEDDLVCAIREVWEETGFDLRKAGLVPDDGHVHSIDVTMREQHLKMFVFRNVPLDTFFEPQTRKEISKIEWYKLDSLPTYNSKKRPQQHPSDPQDTTLLTTNKLYMVAPFLPALKRWIHQQRKRDAHAVSRHSHPKSDYQDLSSQHPAPPHLGLDYQNVTLQIAAPDLESEPESASHAARTLADPADELKRLLSLASLNQTSAQPPPSHPQNPPSSQPAPQADMLLAMLRAPHSMQPAPGASALPRTPLEQMLHTTQEPYTPQAHHVKPSPHVTQRPPPDFSLPQHQQTSSFNGHVHPQTQPFAQPQQSFFPPSAQPPFFQDPAAPNRAHPLQHHPQMVAALQPQGRGAIAHGPTAPKASQLPQPNMNSHTMSLLQAFKTPAQQYTQPAQFQTQPQNSSMVHNAPNYHANAQPQPGYSNVQASQQYASQSSANSMPNINDSTTLKDGSRSQHQNSLLGLFKSPIAQTASIATNSTAAQNNEHVHTRASSLQPAQPPLSTQTSAPAQPPKQGNAYVAMLTRTLPKSTNALPTKSGLQAPSGNGSPSRDKPQMGHGLSKAPTTILSRPVSQSSAAQVRNFTAPQSRDTASSRDHTPVEASTNGSNFTILQRPATKQDTSSSTKSAAVPSPVQNVEQSRSFQPKVLRRPETIKVGSSSSGLPLRQPSQSAQNGSEQRDTLLALFAKSGPGKTSSDELDSTRPGPPSSGSASPMPGDPSSFRPRIFSNASAVSNGDGMKSPSTPVETKGFLLDYLNGVVKGEHYKGSKRPQI